MMPHHNAYASAIPLPVYSTDPGVHADLARSERDRGNGLAAAAHDVAAEALVLREDEPARAALALYNVATGYLMTGDMTSAAPWYRLALTLDPELVIAHQNLAAVCQRLGLYGEAEAHRNAAYSRQRVFVEPCSTAPHRLLLLCTGQEGNIPFDALVPSHRCHRIKYFIDRAGRAEDHTLPEFDLVFNVIGEPDVAAPLGERIREFAERCGRPVLNQPAAVARCARERLPDLLDGIADVVVAPCIRIARPEGYANGFAARLEDAGIHFPVLVRPIATHGGEGLELHQDLASLGRTLHHSAQPHYLTRFIDTRSADGHYRKYRMIFVDRKPYPYHAAISRGWLVHYFSADMLAHPWKIAEEQRFLEDPARVLGKRAMAALCAIGMRLDLDFGGIDFTLLADERILVFEANATMLVHYERSDGPLAHKNESVGRIAAAFDALQKKVVARARAAGRHARQGCAPG
jgi:glutathione synthase/RimK-type ligase-like ATP-grasp enzyme